MQTNTLSSGKPEPSEYAPYYGQYISLVQGDDVVRSLEQQIAGTVELLSALTESQGEHRYAPDKWSIKQVIGHLSDGERVFSYRAMRIARADRTPLASFEQNDYVANGPFERCRLADLVDEFASIRRATVHLFRQLDEAAWTRRGTASDKEVSVRALAYIIAGHELHHRAVLKEKYLKAAARSAG